MRISDWSSDVCSSDLEMQKQYVVTARAKGLSPLKTILKYPLRLSLNHAIADIGMILPAMISGSALVAIVMDLPTNGPLLLRSLQSQDMYLAGAFLLFRAEMGRAACRERVGL